MKPVNFSFLDSHKSSVLQIYKELLRHATHLRGIRTNNPNDRDAILHDIKSFFKTEKGQTSSKIVQDKLEIAYEVERMLAKAFYSLPIETRETYFKETRNLLVNNISAYKTSKPAGLKNTHGQRIKKDILNHQDLEQQHITNYVNRYIKEKQRVGALPKVIDSHILKEIIKPEALHARAQLDIRRVEKLLKKGPYLPRISWSASGVYLVRGPFKQNPIIGRLIGKKVKAEQELINIVNTYNNDKYLYLSEDKWEEAIKEQFKHSEAKNGERNISENKIVLTELVDTSPWSKTIEDLIKEKEGMISEAKVFYKNYAKEELPKVLKKMKDHSFKIHTNKLNQFESLSQESWDCTPFDEIMEKPTLRQLVKSYGFNSDSS
ncbi:hypothetical protein WICMUC_004033 [Wickerhamomyces mucosus]|uniref:Uncharacterized protein n=1 Tax=Wickerhamomyces mucosus TaxID=1378264 RepID=A0A9P8TBA8_9ASCO|nr:hypothetical protein WICMUC_004033 [Wickerhamomyces mucosus]